MSHGTTNVQQIVGRPAGPIGFGLMGLTMPGAKIEREDAVKVMKAALEQGANLWNGGIFYGTPDANSLHLVRYYFDKYPEDADKVILSIKGAFSLEGGPTGSPDAIRESVEYAIETLGPSKRIDIFEMARVDPKVPIETSLNVLREILEEGKIGGVGLSEVKVDTIRRAQAVCPIAAVEVELSLFTPDPAQNGIMEICNELTIPVIAYSPMGRGWLTGQFRSLDDLSPTDYRRALPRFHPKVFEQNIKLVEAVEQLAKLKGTSTAQVALAWVIRQGAIPIPGSSKVDRVQSNSTPSPLTDEDMSQLQTILDTMPIAGDRYGEVDERFLNG